MALEVKSLKRKFVHNGETLTDPNPEMSPKEVLEFYANTYPELTTAQVLEKEAEAENLVYEFTVVKGTKG